MDIYCYSNLAKSKTPPSYQPMEGLFNITCHTVCNHRHIYRLQNGLYRAENRILYRCKEKLQ